MFGTAPLLEITNLEFQVTNKWVHLSWVDGRDNSRTVSVETDDVIHFIMGKYNLNKSDAKYWAHHHLTRPVIRSYMENKGIL